MESYGAPEKTFSAYEKVSSRHLNNSVSRVFQGSLTRLSSLALRETDELMRNIVAYIIEWNDSSRTRQEHRELPASLTHTLTWFTEDLELLRGCLPEKLSYAFVDKVKFVFQKSKIEEATTRLHERKGTANLALSTLGRYVVVSQEALQRTLMPVKAE